MDRSARMDQVNHFDYAQKERMDGRNRGPAAEMIVAKDSDYADGLITEDAVSTIQRPAKSDKPFFLAAGFLTHCRITLQRNIGIFIRRGDGRVDLQLLQRRCRN